MNWQYIGLVFLVISGVTFALSETELVNIALGEYNKSVPQQYRIEYLDVQIQKSPDPPMYFIWWQRKVNSIPVQNDQFLVRIYCQIPN